MDKKGNNAGSWVFGILVVTGFFLLGFNRWFDSSGNEVKENVKTAKIGCLPQGHGNLAQHFHLHLTIVIDGVTQTIPASVGVAPSCMSEIHTHDASGELHVESVLMGKKFTLGQFFSVWGKNFSRDRIFDRAVGDGYELLMTVDDVETQEFGDIVLKDDQKIVIEYKKKGE